jgi:methyl acetate hydrolase
MTGGVRLGRRDIDAALAGSVATGDLPGVAACAASVDGSRYHGAFGSADLATGDRLRDDALFFIASMTKIVTSVAAMQLVESGKLDLDDPLDRLVPKLGKVQVLEGFDERDQPRLRAPKRRITLRHLLTHTSGFAYGHWNAPIKRYAELLRIPDVLSMRESALDLPLVSDPGEEWHYGISTDFVGKAVEAASGERLDGYFSKHILEPLGMHDTFYQVPASKQLRIARIHSRQPDGGLIPVDVPAPSEPELFPGGVGLFATAGDYLALTRMLLNDGTLNGRRVLQADTVDCMSQNHLGGAIVQPMESQLPFWSENVDLFPGQEKHWGLGFMINTRPGGAGRSAGSLTWAGACNSFFWIDRSAGITGVFMSQVVPFCDARALRAFHEFERAVNGSRVQ